MTPAVTVRDATEGNREAVVSIYYQVLATAMWREQPTSRAERRAWLSAWATRGVQVLGVAPAAVVVVDAPAAGAVVAGKPLPARSAPMTTTT